LGSTRTQRVDVRVLAATNASLTQMVAEKKFRSDLYYRLKVFPIDVPPLRDCRDDVSPRSRTAVRMATLSLATKIRRVRDFIPLRSNQKVTPLLSRLKITRLLHSV
jgi:formate hydrogenlyase transcriptional activator